MSKHTPGPWTVDPRTHNRCGVVGATAFVADCSPRAGGPMEIAQCQANAQLIAAAPDMKVCCDEMLVVVQGLLLERNNSDQVIKDLEYMLSSLMIVTRKAEGK